MTGIISAESQSAVDELLVAARRDHMSPDEVADRLEMVAYFHRDVLGIDAREWIASLFESTLRDVERSHRNHEYSVEAILIVTYIEDALARSLDEIARMQRRARDLQTALHEGVMLEDAIAHPGARLEATLPRLSNTLVQHGVRLSGVETSLLMHQGVHVDDVRRLMRLPRSGT